MLWIIPGTAVSYLIGSIPTAYIFGRALKGIDIRQYGSGNVGATNALRVLGKTAGITVLVLDILKGFLAVLLLSSFLGPKIPAISPEFLQVILGLSCICGHNWTIFLRFKGGKGLATTLGVLLCFGLKIKGFMIILGLSILVWLIVFIFSRIVSVASITSAAFLPILTVIFKQKEILLYSSIVFSVLVILRHKANLVRIFKGKEPRLSFKKHN